MKTRKIAFLPFFLLIGACSSTGQSASPIVPAKTIQITAKTAISMATVASTLAVASLIHVVYDPLAPNWEIEEARLGNDVFRFSLKMKRYHTGGAGEAIQIVKRRASQLQIEQGFSAYHILEYSEGIDSQTIGARRVADGVVKLVSQNQADSFMQNEVY